MYAYVSVHKHTHTCLQYTPLHMAAWNGNLDVVRYLMDKGADVNAKKDDGVCVS